MPARPGDRVSQAAANDSAASRSSLKAVASRGPAATANAGRPNDRRHRPPGHGVDPDIGDSGILHG
jgi:hypothetical protein